MMILGSTEERTDGERVLVVELLFFTDFAILYVVNARVIYLSVLSKRVCVINFVATTFANNKAITVHHSHNNKRSVISKSSEVITIL
jgi:hypothetical protein